MTGLFYVLVALGIVFVVWAYANEEKLVAFEDKMMANLRRKYAKKQPQNKSARVSAVRKQNGKNSRRPFSDNMMRKSSVRGEMMQNDKRVVA